MRTLKLNIQNEVFDKVYYFLSNLPKDEVQIVEDLSYLESEIKKGADSGISTKSHEKILKSIKEKYV